MKRRSKQDAPTLKHHKSSGSSFAYFPATAEQREKAKEENKEPRPNQLWFGPYDDPQTRKEFARFVSLWEANGRELPPEGIDAVLKVKGLVDLYESHAAVYYRRADGTPTQEPEQIKITMRLLTARFGGIPAADFSLRCLKDFRKELVDSGSQSRKTVNQRCWRVRRLFDWAAEEEHIPVETALKLKALSPLKEGRSAAYETPEVLPVPEEHFHAALPFMTPTVRCMVWLQYWTGMRAREVRYFCLDHLDTTDDVVHIYSPPIHKTRHRQRPRTIGLGPKAQAVLREYLDSLPNLPAPGAELFSPARSLAERHALARANAKNPPRTKRSSKVNGVASAGRPVGTRYSKDSYRCAVVRACKAARVPQWSPSRLRHNTATRLTQEIGIEAARVALGHRCQSQTAVYTLQDLKKAVRVQADHG